MMDLLGSELSLSSPKTGMYWLGLVPGLLP